MCQWNKFKSYKTANSISKYVNSFKNTWDRPRKTYISTNIHSIHLKRPQSEQACLFVVTNFFPKEYIWLLIVTGESIKSSKIHSLTDSKRPSPMSFRKSQSVPESRSGLTWSQWGLSWTLFAILSVFIFQNHENGLETSDQKSKSSKHTCQQPGRRISIWVSFCDRNVKKGDHDSVRARCFCSSSQAKSIIVILSHYKKLFKIIQPFHHKK